MKTAITPIRKIYILVFIVLISECISLISYAQKDSGWRERPVVQLSGFADIYYVYDFNQPSTKDRQVYFYHFNRHNQINLNLGYLKFSVQHPKYRANLALHLGTYAVDNYSSEPGMLKHLFEANSGISLNSKNTFWMDVGVFASHIGFESAVSMDNWTLTRSLLAENSPYYLTGVKLTYHPNPKWEFATLVCNGWQHIRKTVGNSMPSLGTQVKFTPDQNTVFNWSSFIGTDDPDSTRRLRIFNNLYLQYQVSPKIGLIAGFDIGLQQKEKNSNNYNSWFSPVLMARYAISEKLTSSVRAEYYQDKNGVMIPAVSAKGFSTSGLSLNLDYFPLPTIVWRIEGRWLSSKDPVFIRNGMPAVTNLFFATSIAVRFH
ncbi:MAG: porin [Bacteroidetes bacterium]|nr:porin [Bacteroidota bacterium]